MAITRSRQAKQMLQDGGRIGLRGGGRDMSTVSAKDIGIGTSKSKRDYTESEKKDQQKTAELNRRIRESSDLGEITKLKNQNRFVSEDFDLLPGDVLDPEVDIKLNRNEERRRRLLRNFINRRPQKKFPIGPLDFLTGGKLGQAGMDFLASKNRPFFGRVIEGGRFQLPGELGEKYGKLDMFDLEKMTQGELEQAYKAYDRARLGGEIRAIGDLKPGFGKDQGDYSVSPLPIEGVFAAKPKDEEIIEETFTPNFRLMADGGRASFQGGGMDASKPDFKSPTTTAKAPPSMGFGNPPPGSTAEGGGNNEPPIKLPKPLKRAVNTIGEGMFLKNLINLNPYGIMKNVGSKILLDKLISEADTQENNNMLFADALTTPNEGKFGVSLNDYNKLKNTGYSDTQIQELQLNPKIDVKEVIRDIEGPIFAAADGGRAGLADGGMPYEGGIMDLESGRQMYFLGKLVKKATRAVKKIVKSPIGKAALFAGLGAYAGGLGPFASGSKLFGGKLAGLAGSGFLKSGSPLMKKLFEGGKFSGGLTGGGKLALGGLFTLAPFLMGDQNDDDDKKQMNFGADIADPKFIMANYPQFLNIRNMADGGMMRADYQEGGDAEPVAKKTMPLLDMDGKEKDYRETGGFVDMGRMERADDVPARLSKNEFVFTADAVRNAGEGDIDKGAEVMYNMMKNLESGGEVSEESQGLEGAREMFQTSQRLEEVL